jgi:hypothetical protein
MSKARPKPSSSRERGLIDGHEPKQNWTFFKGLVPKPDEAPLYDVLLFIARTARKMPVVFSVKYIYLHYFCAGQNSIA